MKKFFILAVAVTMFYGCENLQPLNKGGVKPTYKEQLQQEDFLLNESGVSYLLDIINSNIDSDAIRNYETSNNVQIYLGEYLSVPCEIAATIVLDKAPEMASYDAFIRDGRFYFRSRYQGIYVFNLVKSNMIVKRVFIDNTSKYKVSNRELKNIIYRNYGNKKLSKLRDSVELYRYLFPEDHDQKTIGMLLFELGVIEQNEEVVKNEGDFLMDHFDIKEKDKMKIIAGQEKVLGSNFSLTNKQLDFNNNSMELNDLITRIIIQKNNPSIDEIIFLENFYSAKPSEELARNISNFYFRLGDVQKGTHYGNIENGMLPTAITGSSIVDQALSSGEQITNSFDEPDGEQENYNKALVYYKEGSYAEAILILENMLESNEEFKGKDDIPFYLGSSYLKTKNLNKAKDNFLKISEDNKNYPEAMYRLGEIYYKLGQKDLAMKRFEENKDIFAGTVWGRKSSIYLLKLK